MGRGEFGNLDLILSMTWRISRAADRCLFKSPLAEEGKWICNSSLAPSIERGSQFFFVFSGSSKEPALNLKRIEWKLGDNLEESENLSVVLNKISVFALLIVKYNCEILFIC